MGPPLASLDAFFYRASGDYLLSMLPHTPLHAAAPCRKRCHCCKCSHCCHNHCFHCRFCWLLPVIRMLIYNLPPLLRPPSPAAYVPISATTVISVAPFCWLRPVVWPIFTICLHHCHHHLYLWWHRHNRSFRCCFLLMVLCWLLPVYSTSNSLTIVPLRRVSLNVTTYSCGAE